jgi:excinuclease UvrABC helicase subunit UvrB
MAEDLTSYSTGVRNPGALHDHDIDTIERMEIHRDLRWARSMF